MSEVKKIATRESYGNALVELGREHTDLVVLDADLAGATKTEIFKHFRNVSWTVELQKQIWLESQQDFLPAVKFHS